MSLRDSQRPPVRGVFPLFSNGLLLFCVVVLAAIVLWQNWPRRKPPNEAHQPVAAGAESAAGKPAPVIAKSVEQTPKSENSPPVLAATTEHAKVSAKSAGPIPKVSLSTSPPTIPSGDRSDEELATIRVFRAASPGVVHIATRTLERDDFSLNVMEVPQGTGTGFVWDREGHIVTNFHVIEGASGAQVALADHSTWSAELVGVAPDKDLAVLKIDVPAERLDITGVLVMAVEKNSTAAAAGLRPTKRDPQGRVIWGDILTAVDDLPVRSTNDLLDALERHRVGDEVTLRVRRDQRQQQIRVRLEAAE